ncbi:hypothetical protein OG698_01105 [Streptomyces sp. NBC_01003]|uniref:hypothetical protein n=1 Tax=Streptomyces sp. NBC_01003 TaxID=2903714 RepID=UPI003867D395|nr:hypothetical protein OG698_01105 [Streptomyces sp. NBC_01003]
MSEPSALRQIAVAVVLLIVDMAVIAWFLWSYAWIGWRDGWNPQDVPEAPRVAWRAVWILVGAAVVTGVGLVALRWRISGAVQLSVLGIGALLFVYLAVRK